jgi:sugar phosphate isomerase/epimerase
MRALLQHTADFFPATRSDVPMLEIFLSPETIIDPSLVQAFRETEYRVHGDPPFTLRIGEACAALRDAHKRYGVDCSAYVTALNPFSQALEDAANGARHAALGRELNQRSLTYVEGVGQHPSNQWPGEASFLIFGFSLEAAKSLGTRLEQNAIVWNGDDVTPQLILLR